MDMKWVRTTKRLPTEADADWDGMICFCDAPYKSISKMHLLDAHSYGWMLDDKAWWLEGYRTERPEPPGEDDE